jgi:hypothetical protein
MTLVPSSKREHNLAGAVGPPHPRKKHFAWQRNASARASGAPNNNGPRENFAPNTAPGG